MFAVPGFKSVRVRVYDSDLGALCGLYDWGLSVYRLFASRAWHLRVEDRASEFMVHELLL